MIFWVRLRVGLSRFADQQFRFMHKLIRFCCALILIKAFVFELSHAQTDRKQPLEAIFSSMEEQLGLIFSYDPSLVSVFSVTLPSEVPLSVQTLSNIKEQVPLDFEILKEGFVLVTTRPLALTLQLEDGNSQPIVGAYLKKNEEYIQSSSDGNGELKLEMSWTQRDTLVFESLGYKSYTVSILDLLESKRQVITLSEKVTVLDNLIIRSYLGDGFSANRKNHSIEIKNGELGILPSDMSKDLLVSLRALPGIHTVTGRAGDLRIRGSTPDQNLVLYNNIPIYHKGYYFGTVSPFSSDLVDEVQVFRSGFGPELGGRVGGAIDISTSQQVAPEVKGSVFTNSYMVGISLKAPVVANKLGIAISARSSHPFDYESPMAKELKRLALYGDSFPALAEATGSELLEDPLEFWDVSGSVIYKSDLIGKITLNALSINNVMTSTLLNEDIDFIARKNELTNTGWSAEWTKKWSSTRLTAFGSKSDYSFDEILTERVLQPRDTLRDNLNMNGINNLRLGTKLESSLGSLGSWSLGYDYTADDVVFGVTVFESIENGPVEVTQLRPASSNLFTTHAFFGNVVIDQFDLFSVDFGLRANRYVENPLRLEPRLFASLFLTNHLTIKGSFGMYSQNIAQSTFFSHTDSPTVRRQWFQAGGRDDRLMKGNMALLGVTYQRPHWLVDIDLYSRVADNVNSLGERGTRPNGRPGPPSRLTGELYATGIDALVKYGRGKFNFWSTYTLSSSSLFFEELKTERFPTNYDQTHVFSISGQFSSGKISTSMSWTWGSGIPDYREDPFFPEQVPFVSTSTEPTPVGDIARFDPTSQVDISIRYTTSTDSDLKFTAGLTVLNLFDQDNFLERDIFTAGFPGQPTVESTQDRFNIGFAPDLMLRLEF